MKQRIILGLGLTMGAAAGYLYWYNVGCSSGSCPITSSPVNSTLYGALLGALTANTFNPAKGKEKIEHEGQDSPKNG